MKHKKIVFIGGDRRQVYAARRVLESGIDTYLSGFERLESSPVPRIIDIDKALEIADIIVFPITGVKEETVPAYYSDKEIKIDSSKLNNKLVFMGKADTLSCTSCEKHDILSREDFAVANALPSAEGAVQAAMENYEGTILGSNCLVIGYGRIGKILSRMLNALNADVTVASRSAENRAHIKADGNNPVCTRLLNDMSNFDIVFNTADALVINREILKNSTNNTVIIDLASLPGGVDFETAKALGFKTIHALGLPGKFSPKAAGKIISDTILTILEEEYRWQRQT